MAQRAQLIYKAADLEQPTALVKVARQLLGRTVMVASSQASIREEAMAYFKRAIKSSNDPDANYGVATMYLEDAVVNAKKGEPFGEMIGLAVQHLEASAIGGNPLAMLNLGIAHLFGYSDNGQKFGNDRDLAGEWFEASGLPEGYAFRSMHLSAVGELEKASEFQRRALSLGFNSPWRKAALDPKLTGYGGASGADINLPWPPNSQGAVPPAW
jgi:TPR repeat protein